MNESNKTNLPPIYDAILEHLSPPKGQGNAYFVFDWSAILNVVPFLLYGISFIDSRLVYWILFFYSIALVLFYTLLINLFRSRMLFVSNPFDFVKVQLLNFVLATIVFGLAHYYLWKLYNASYNGTIASPVDLIYFSFITVATVGYGDISPAWVISKILTMSEVFFGMWFIVTVVPVAVADQAERIRHYRDSRQSVFSELQKGIDNGEIRKVDLSADENEIGE